MDYIILLGGIALLLASGNYLVEGSVSLARHFKVSTLVIGVVIVSFGTSAPELLVSLQAAIRGHADISIGNVIGSNISNIALVLGLTAMMFPILISKKVMRLDYPFLILTSFLLLYFLIDGELLLYEGIILFLLLISYLIYSIFKSRKETKDKAEAIQAPKFSMPISFVIVAGASIGLVLGARWLVESASRIAIQWGVSERIISLTIVAFGTSIPELAASIIGMIKKEPDISIGNIIGSNLFNILGILGLSATISPIHNIDPGLFQIDIYWMLGLTLGLLALIVMPFNRFIISRLKGAVLFATYIIYILLLFH
jgi:cation:H+ antiporter